MIGEIVLSGPDTGCSQKAPVVAGRCARRVRHLFELRLTLRARAPASTSNIGPGFDVLDRPPRSPLYTEVTLRPAEALSLTTSGEGSQFPADSSHLAVRVAASVLGHENFEMTVASDIPPGRGLGSSAALAVAAAAAAGSADPLEVAASFDGHAENATASMSGGASSAATLSSWDGRVLWRRLPLDAGIELVLVVPDHTLETKAAREGCCPTRCRSAMPCSTSVASAFSLPGWATGHSSSERPERIASTRTAGACSIRRRQS